MTTTEPLDLQELGDALTDPPLATCGGRAGGPSAGSPWPSSSSPSSAPGPSPPRPC